MSVLPPENHQLPAPVSTFLPNAEDVHQRFCKAREAAKRVRVVALAAEGGAVILALVRLMGGTASVWVPLVILVFTLLDVVLRAYAEHLRLFGQHCRRLSLRAYARSTDIVGGALASTLLETPGGLGVLARGGPCKNLEEYYQATATVGDDRIREVYAGSAFFSSRLLQLYAHFLLGILLAFGAVSAMTLYRFAVTETYARATREKMVDAMCSVVLVYVLVRILETMERAYRVAGRFREVLRSLSREPRGPELTELGEEYDLERSSGFEAPTTIYLLFDKRLTRAWKEYWYAVVSKPRNNP